MTARIRPFDSRDLDQIVDLSLRAWAPVFASFENVLGSTIFLRLYPEWKSDQAKAVRDTITGERIETWVADVEGRVAGFIAWEVTEADDSAEVHMLAVDPDYQQRGIGTQLNQFALESFTRAGLTLAVVATGGDPGHAPARLAYEKVGYTPLPLVRYYKAL